jgi:hypothetical protein
MNDVLHKPMDAGILMRTVAHHVRQAREASL